MKSFGIPPNYLEYLAQNGETWREVVKHEVKVCETRRKAATGQRGKLRKDTATSATAASIPCSHCPRLFCSQIILISHLRTNGCLPQS